MNSMRVGARRSSGAGLIGLFVAVLTVAVLYVGGEWFVTQHVKTALEEVLQEDMHAELEVESVGLDGWLFSGRRSGDAVVLLPSDERVPVEFKMIGNPLTGSTITVEGDQRLKLRLRDLFGDIF
ncbi:hypothetical protein [Thioalkalivibrio sp.]|uniref:hypothetical protein n=1 Tax=Thioalkalivibrio sp. TaxID=2093813 RepID=UPI0012D4CD98|nr:hypothetical protein [Thioalkalivibrio sp.]TVP82198.1 MAG: hypothetical protein EA346_03275 [Thioalkalivibrio sp.]